LPDVLEDLLKNQDVTALKLISKNFLSAICGDGQLVTEQYSWKELPT